MSFTNAFMESKNYDKFMIYVFSWMNVGYLWSGWILSAKFFYFSGSQSAFKKEVFDTGVGIYDSLTHLSPMHQVFWCFQSVEKGCSGSEWVKEFLIVSFDRLWFIMLLGMWVDSFQMIRSSTLTTNLVSCSKKINDA